MRTPSQIIVFVCALLGMGTSAYGQQPAQFSIGLSYVGLQGDYGYHTDYGGFGVDGTVAAATTHPFTFEGDVDFHRHVNSPAGRVTYITWMLLLQGGVRIQGGQDRTTMFAHVLAGIAHAGYYDDGFCRSIRGTTCAGGGRGPILTGGAGFDHALTPRTSARAQIDVPISGGGPTFRLVTGIVWKR